jgi:hypothetical protein
MAFSQLKSANPSKSPSQDRPSTPAAATGNIPLIDLHSPKKNLNLNQSHLILHHRHRLLAVDSHLRSCRLERPRTRPSRSSSSPQLNFLYPPRRQDSLTVDQRLEPNSRTSSHAQSSSISSFHSVSLSSDTDTSRPGSISNFIATFPIERKHSSSSANSGPNDIDSVSLTESFEEVSPSALASPATEEKIEWQYAMRKPPKLPERPPSTNPQRKYHPLNQGEEH